MQETQQTWVRSLGWKDPLEEEIATLSSIFALGTSMDRGAGQATYSPCCHRVRQDSTHSCNQLFGQSDIVVSRESLHSQSTMSHLGFSRVILRSNTHRSRVSYSSLSKGLGTVSFRWGPPVGLSRHEPSPPDTASAGFIGMKPRFPRPKDQAALRRKAAIVQDRILADSRKKTKQAERMLGDAASVSSRAKKKGREAELLAQDSAKVRARDMTPGASMSSGPGGGLA